jgi:DNA mismatch endonuclease (patch repair protein)
MVLCRELCRSGLRFKRNVVTLPGKPDVVFQQARFAVFCDGDFWHGRHWTARREKLARGANAVYWVAKIEANVRRDRRHRASLRRDGWHVLRLWESDILRNVRRCATRVGMRLSDHRSHAPRQGSLR